MNLFAIKPTLPKILLSGLLINAAITPTVYAAAGNGITRSTAYAISLLGLVVLSLAIYLTVVIIQPDKF